MSNDSEDSWMDVDGVDIQNLSLGLEDFGILDGKETPGEPSGKFEDLNMSKELLHKFRTDAAKSFFNQFGVINHQINSFNDFMENGIYKFFDSIGEYHVQPGYKVSSKVSEGWKHATITFGKVTIEKPSFLDEKGDVKKLTPREARFQNVTYSSRVNAEVTVKIYVKKRMTSDKAKTGSEQFIYDHVLHEEKGNMLIGRIPIMVKSNLCSLDGTGKGECDFDYGGYFLIKGAEKIFVAQEQRCLRRLWVSKVSKSPNWMVTSYHPDGFRRKIIHIKLTETPIANGLNGGKTINVLFLYATIPVWILFFALGASSDKEIVQIIDMDIGNPALVNILRSTINDADHSCNGFRKNGKALEYLQDQIRSTKFPPEEPLDECLEKYLFPSLKGKQKALFLGYMVKCLLLSYFGQRKLDNRDDFRNKRLELASALLGRELRICFRHALNRMGKALEKDLSEDKQLKPIECYFDAWLVTNGLNSAFSSGKWSNPLNRTERTSGVVATLKRANPLQMIAEMRKTRVQIQYMGKLGDARFPNPSFWGRLCIISTPDDENCGLVKNLAVTCLISTSLPEPSLDKLKECGMETLDDISPTLLSERERVFLNGDWVGCCKDSSVFVHKLRSMRRSMLIHPQVEIKRDRQQREVRIFSDEGRILRPLLIVENNRICFSLEKRKRFESSGRSFKFLLEEKLIEFIGTEEEEDCVVAWVLEDLDNTDKLQLQYTHLELDPSFLLGFSCGIIPFANHNNARRVLYQAEKHSKQAIGFNSVNPSVRVDTLCHQLYYPQKPLFKTVLSDCLGKPEYFNGQNAIVAVNVHQGYNQEDSLVMNRASLERGMFRTEHFRSYKDDTENREAEGRKGYKPKERVDFGKPGSGYGRIDSIEDDGFPFVGANLTSNDIVIGKVGGLGVKLKHTEKGMVQRVVVSSNDDGKNFAVVTLRQVRSPCLGDKFSSMHGQKGVVGFIESQENFPFTREGIVPDIVINPHAFPTRQTPSQLLEAALGKGIACGGTMSYATPFTATSFDAITDQLHRNGFSRWGSERVYDGRSGKKLQSLIFMGPTFYQRLVHMAEDKVKFRNRGPVHPLTRQPVADRKRFGGVKFGEMERDCLLAHGAAANLYERLFVLSDFSQMFICRNCQRVANVIQRSVNKSTVRGPYCQFCKSAENIVKINVPYGAKLLYQELFSMGICLKFDTELT